MAFRVQSDRLQPAALRPGDTVGLVAPASSFRRDDFEAGCAKLRRLGYEPVYLPSIFDRSLYFAGSTDRRLRELHEMFTRPEVMAILCVRGGYGCNYLLPHLDLELIRANPKIFAGCSDVTSLLTYLSDAGLVTFHAPMVAGDFARTNGIDSAAWLAAVANENDYERQFGADEVKPLREGTGEGTLYGGCLSLLVASLGTPYEIRTEGTILFIEDRAEAPYRIDRMLMQLKLAGKFDAVRGLLFGEMIDCNPPTGQAYTREHVIMRLLGDLPVPMAYGLKSGHVSSQSFTLPIGVPAKLTVGRSVTLHYGAAVRAGQAAAKVSGT